MKKVKLVTICSVIFIIMSCSKDKEGSNTFSDKKDLGNIQVQIKELKESVEKRTEEIETLHTDLIIYKEMLERLKNEVNMQKKITTSLPEVIVRQGYVKDAEINEKHMSLLVEYAEMTVDENAPKKFIIANKEKEVISLQLGKYSIYILINLLPVPISGEKFIKNNHDGLYDFYFIQNKLVMIVERYVA